MGHTELLSLVRQVVRGKFQDHGGDPDAELAELILIRNGEYCGRKFQTAGTERPLQAVWFCEEDQLKIYGPESSLVEVVEGLSGQRAIIARAA